MVEIYHKLQKDQIPIVNLVEMEFMDVMVHIFGPKTLRKLILFCMT